MTCNSIRTHIEEADAALRKATVIALENKHDEIILRHCRAILSCFDDSVADVNSKRPFLRS